MEELQILCENCREVFRTPANQSRYVCPRCMSDRCRIFGDSGRRSAQQQEQQANQRQWGQSQPFREHSVQHQSISVRIQMNPDGTWTQTISGPQGVQETRTVERPQPPPGMFDHFTRLFPSGAGSTEAAQAAPFRYDGGNSALNWLFQQAQADGTPHDPTPQIIIDSLRRTVCKQDGKQPPENGTDEASSCAVCQEEWQTGNVRVSLPCRHSFHEDCIVPWLRSSRACPMCRAPLPSEEELM